MSAVNSYLMIFATYNLKLERGRRSCHGCKGEPVDMTVWDDHRSELRSFWTVIFDQTFRVLREYGEADPEIEKFGDLFFLATLVGQINEAFDNISDKNLTGKVIYAERIDRHIQAALSAMEADPSRTKRLGEILPGTSYGYDFSIVTNRLRKVRGQFADSRDQEDLRNFGIAIAEALATASKLAPRTTDRNWR
ncbi:MAG: hypothetical protein C5B49_15840 [Bdellovibrio sp.]|nr:MAG: hypothetical protein C5B49_15840 [Bdellovibrio sp.]